MGEPIKLPDGRIAHGHAQAAAMRGETEERTEVTGEPATLFPVQPPIPANAVTFQGVRGIGASIEQALYDAGFLTWADVLRVDVAEIDRRISGIGLNRAKLLRAYAHAMVQSQ